MHALENYENMGHVINLQIGGGGNQDFFFRQQKPSAGQPADCGKPPMPGKQLQ